MSTYDKLKQRIISIPSDFTYKELKRFLLHFGYIEDNKGPTSGSRVKFFRESDKSIIMLHKPHPGDIVGKSALRAVVDKLKGQGDLDD